MNFQETVVVERMIIFVSLEIVEGGGKTVWGDVNAIGTVLEGLTFDVVLDNNGKDLDAVK
ncbi:hypothetical protein HanHA300_Chr15g0550871 [Helianthus annuus]|nr:hypothetical protein HanHA300_Chr15g0550871 [Helianthus annuus]KAJ0651181.1 hypothetical protein HanOQP8_Chr15g0558231 [Helianthus annuus]